MQITEVASNFGSKIILKFIIESRTQMCRRFKLRRKLQEKQTSNEKLDLSEDYDIVCVDVSKN